MSNQHNHSHNHHDVKNIKVAFFLNLFFTLVELIGGLYVNSMAILADAMHDLGDSLSLGFAWYFQKLSKKGRDDTFSYGYKRFSVLGAIINSIVLIVGSVFILNETIPRLWNPEQPDTQGMMALSLLGIIVNGAAVLRLNKGTSINEKVVSLHLLEDVLGWVAVLAGSIVMHFYQLPIIDPLLSVLIACYIIYNVYSNLKESFKIILQANPPSVNEKQLANEIKQIADVADVHDMHSWSMDGSYHVMTIHVVLKKHTEASRHTAIKTEVRKIMSDHRVNHVTIEIDTCAENCELENC